MLDKVFWGIFEKTGNIDAYMAYRNGLVPYDDEMKQAGLDTGNKTDLTGLYSLPEKTEEQFYGNI